MSKLFSNKLLSVGILIALILGAFFIWRAISEDETAVTTLSDTEAESVSDRVGDLEPSLATSAVDRVVALLENDVWIDAALKQQGSVEELTPQEQEIDFVDNNTCEGCHAEQFEEWRSSHHAQAMQPADETTVLGDFNDVAFTSFGVTSRFFRDGDKYIVHTQDQEGIYRDFEVAYTFGVEPLQQYLLAFPEGRYQAFTVLWDTTEKRWFSLYPDTEITFNDELHWTDRHFTWNSSCAECHSTDLKLNFDLATTAYETSWTEINVSCQACHGPGEAHVAWAQQETEEVNYSGVSEQGFLVDYGSMDAADQVETCARCHSRRYPISLDDQHAQPYLDHFTPELLREGMYHADGQILEEVYVYGSYIQSKMYQQGVSCTNCHNVHTGELHQPGNATCTACHQMTPPTPTFPTLTSKAYDTPEHHFHEPDSAGAQCVNCHMPAQNYMVIDPRRDHSLRIPRPDLSVKLGTPNACTQCHIDQEATWAVESMNEWYGDDWQRPHYGETLAQGRLGEPAGLEPLGQLAGDEGQPAIVRATALDLLPNYGEGGLASLQAGLAAEMPPLLRVAAVRSVSRLNFSPEVMVDILAPLLVDPIRAVRIEAANGLAGIPRTYLDETELGDFDASLLEYMTAQVALTDQPEGYANLGSLFTWHGYLEQAEQAYETAIARDSHFYQAQSNLATLYYRQGEWEKAEAVLQDGLTTSPDAGYLHYSLALLLVEQERTEEAIEHFDQAAALLQDDPRVQYNYGLLLQQVSRYSDALAALQRANQLQPDDPDFLYGLITFHMNAGEWEPAKVYAEQLVQLYPSVPEFQSLLASLRDRG